VVVDGNRFRQWSDVPFQTIVKGDSKLGNIAAASILAKTYRDDYMDSIAAEYPMYDWLSNKGYPTRAHRQAIAQYGTTPYHRLTFRLLP
jgi:ribonuclease HII